MTSDVGEPEHLLVAQDVFAGDRFWAALDRLADRRGHDAHPRILVGLTDPTSRYELRCVRCEQPVATMGVRRDVAAD